MNKHLDYKAKFKRFDSEEKLMSFAENPEGKKLSMGIKFEGRGLILSTHFIWIIKILKASSIQRKHTMSLDCKLSF